MAFFNNKNIVNTPEAKYNKYVSNILLVICFSVINIALLVTNAGSYFLFSAFLPYYIVDYGMFWCGLYPSEYYEGIAEIELMDISFFYVTIAVAVVIILAYLICWIFARKKKIAALITALVFFVIDTMSMLLISGFSLDSGMDIVFHVLIIVSLSIGVAAYFKMKQESQQSVPEFANYQQNFVNNVQNNENIMNPSAMYSNVLRVAEECKSRVFIEEFVDGMHIVCRRVKHTNELIINNCVYDEYEGIVEFAHTLTACFNGHRVECVFDGISSVKLFVDSQEVAKKIRIV